MSLRWDNPCLRASAGVEGGVDAPRYDTLFAVLSDLAVLRVHHGVHAISRDGSGFRYNQSLYNYIKYISFSKIISDMSHDREDGSKSPYDTLCVGD